MAYEFKKKITYSLLLYGFITILLFGSTYWLNFDIGRRLATLDQKRSELAIHTSNESVFLSLKRDASRAKIEQVFLESILPQQEDLINFRSEINRLAQQNNLSLSFSFGQEQAGNDTNPGSVAFNIRVSGSLLNILTFFDFLERGKYLSANDQVNITKGEKDYLGTINGKVFSR